MTNPAPTQTPVAGKTLGIVGLVFAFLAPVIGLILSIVAGGQSKKVGAKNTPAKAGLILSIIFIVLYVVIAIAVGASIGAACSSGAATCTTTVG
jgi:hypothetical protein